MRQTPGEIERGSMAIIDAELLARGIRLEGENAAVIRRCIHASADFDYAENLRFTPGAVTRGIEALQKGGVIVTDTNMALAGLSRPCLARLKASARCYMAEEETASLSRQLGGTRAEASVERAAAEFPEAVYAVGNAPTALLRLADKLEAGLRPALIVAVPVGFVNVVESKERIWEACRRLHLPCIAAMGRKGGSSIAAAVCNALLYLAADCLEPEKRGWG